MKVGFIGLGQMGSAMAVNLIKAGHEVTVYNRSRDKAEALAGEGAKVAATVADACGGEAVFTMLAHDDALSAVVHGDGGVLASLGKGAVHISASTISVAMSERLTKEHTAAGQRFVAAPVFGRPEAAAAAKLSLPPRVRQTPSSRLRRSSTPSVNAPSSSARSRSLPISSSSAAISSLLRSSSRSAKPWRWSRRVASTGMPISIS